MAQGRVAIVGGGLAGLAAGLRLKSYGYSVDLFERSRLLGGKATSFEIEGVEVDNGQHVFLACCTEFIDLVHGLGLQMPGTAETALYLQERFEALLLSRTRAPIHLRAIDLPAPFHLIRALLSSRQLGALGRVQVSVALAQLRLVDTLPGESFGAWLRRHGQGSKTFRGFWEPFLVPALNAEIDDVAADAGAFVIRTAFLQDAKAGRFGYSRLPLGRIAQAAGTRLDNVYLRTPIVGLLGEEQSAGRRSAVELRAQDGQIRRYDGAVLAVPPQKLKTIVHSPKVLGIYGLDQFKPAAIIDVHLWYDLPSGTVLKGGFAALLDSPVQWVFEKSAPLGETYLCCSMSAAGRYVSWPVADLVDLARSELGASLPDLRAAKTVRCAVTRDMEATFVPSIGLIRPGSMTQSRQVVLAGAWTDTGWPATMESAVRSGRQAAETLHSAHG